MEARKKKIKDRLLFGLALIVWCAVVFVIATSVAHQWFSVDEQNDNIKDYYVSDVADYIYLAAPELEGTAEEIVDFLENRVPENVKAELKKDWKIVIGYEYIEGDETDVYAREGVREGVTEMRSHTMMITAVEDPDVTFRIFVHELGHLVDFSFGYISKREAFQKIYLNHIDTWETIDENVAPGYSTSKPEEFFAETFKEYYLYPEHLWSTAPDAAAFIENHLEAVRESGFLKQTLWNVEAYLKRTR